MNNSPSKKRRRKGEGNGTIHWRTVTKNGKDYPQAYYHWQENGQKRTKYIPKKLLGEIQEANATKRPIIEILRLLGVVDSPSKTRRNKGEGSGSIHWRTITKNGKDYQQAYYHYELWNDGDRTFKSSRYIPKRLLKRVQQMEHEKALVNEILRVLGVIK